MPTVAKWSNAVSLCLHRYTKVEQCGNGVRCVAEWLRQHGRGSERPLRLESRGGLIEARFIAPGTVEVNMGEPRFATPARNHLQLDSVEIAYTEVSMGNPHIVLEVEDIDTAPVAELGPRLESHPRFPARTNVGFLQIVDREKLLNGPKEVTRENLNYPQVSRLDFPTNSGAHTVLPLLDMEIEHFKKSQNSKRDFIVAVNESINDECREANQQVWFIDISQETRPFGVANWTVKEASGKFCDRGERFGAHAPQENMTPIFHKKILFVTWFSAGLRALDVRNPYEPKEIAYYIPAITADTKADPTCLRRRSAATCKIAIQTNNVEVDDRGYIYIVDRADTGLHILDLTGSARELASYPQK